MSGAIVAQSNTIHTGAIGKANLTLNSVGSGNALFLIVGYYDSGFTTANAANVFDNVATATAYTMDSQNTGSHCAVSIYRRFGVAAGSYKITANAPSAATGADVYWSLAALDVSGLSGVVDTGGVANTTASSTGPVEVTTGTLAAPVEFVIVGASVNATNENLANPAGWIQIYLTNLLPSFGAAYQNTSATTALTPSFGTITSDVWQVATAAYELPSTYTGITRFCANGHVQANTITGSVALPTGVLMRVCANGTIQISGATSTTVGEQIRICANGQMQANAFD